MATPMKHRGTYLILISAGLAIGLVYAIFPVLWMLSSLSQVEHGDLFAAAEDSPEGLHAGSLSGHLGQQHEGQVLPEQLSRGLIGHFADLVCGNSVRLQLQPALVQVPKAIKYAHNKHADCAAHHAPDPILRTRGRLQAVHTYFALILTYMVFTLPYAILMMTGYFNTLPKELDEAVMVDGGSSFYALWRVLVPISVPGIVATGVYTFLLAYNEFLFALTLTKTTDMRTVPIGIQLLMGQHAYQWNEMMAMSILGSLPILVIYMVAQRYFLAGMTAGSVKA